MNMDIGVRTRDRLITGFLPTLSLSIPPGIARIVVIIPPTVVTIPSWEYDNPMMSRAYIAIKSNTMRAAKALITATSTITQTVLPRVIVSLI